MSAKYRMTQVMEVLPARWYDTYMKDKYHNLHRRMRREHHTIDAMMRIYCHAHHGTNKDALCESCTELIEYAHLRLLKCRYQQKKPTCGNCPANCYKPSMEARMMDVMRYSGPRMTYRHPYYALMHLIDSLRKAPPRKARQKEEKDKD